MPRPYGELVGAGHAPPSSISAHTTDSIQIFRLFYARLFTKRSLIISSKWQSRKAAACSHMVIRAM